MKQSFCLLFISIFVSTLLLSICLYGQSYQTFSSELQQIISKTKWRIGPFRVYPLIQFKDIGYDDNVYYKRKEDNPISDYTATFSFQARVYLLFRNYLILSLVENPEYVYYLKQKRERRLNNLISPSIKLLLFNRFFIGGGYLSHNRRYRASSEFDVRANEITKGYNGNFFFETARKTSFGFSIAERSISYEDITLPGEEIFLSRALNRTEKTGSFEFYYKILSEKFFFLNGGYTIYNFKHIESRWRDSYSYQFYSGIRFPLLGRVRGTFSLGYKKLTPKRTYKRSFSGLVGNTSLDIRTGRFGFRFQYNRDSYFSYYTNNVFFLEDRYGTGISFYLTRFLRLDYDLIYSEINYPEAVLIIRPDNTFGEVKRHDIQHLYIGGVVIRIIRNTGLGVRINYWDRKSNIRWVERNRWYIGLYLTYAF